MDLARAIAIASAAHEGQTDKSGEPYILHPLTVMINVKTNDEKIVAVLHDVVEDTDLNIYDLEAEGFSKTILYAIDAISKRDGETTDCYYDRIMENSLAMKVKIKDIEHNLKLTRLLSVTKKELYNISVYHKYWKIRQ